MIRIDERHIQSLSRSDTLAEVRTALGNAVKLELSTIPVYLTALFSLKQNSNRAAGALVQSVVMEEMLHLTLACNTLTAIGGTPRLWAAGQALRYPGPMPLSVDDGLLVSLAALTRDHVQQVFMPIEKPDTQAILPGETAPGPAPRVPGEYASIGDFYQAIVATLARLEQGGVPCFADPRLDWQVDVAKWFPPLGGPCPHGMASDLASARAALRTIVEQGEGAQVGATFSPEDGDDGAYAHYFRFAEIVHGKRLVPDSAAPSGWSYSGTAVPLDEHMVHQLLPNAALSDYEPGSAVFLAGQQFYGVYQRLLQTLDLVFNGAPDTLKAALGIMYELKLVAQKVVQHPASAGAPQVIAAPPFMLARTR